MRSFRPVLLVAAAPVVAALAGAGTRSTPLPLPEPSANRGRTGSYRCETSNARYNYHVYVPSSYSGDAPAGLHLFFHGQGGQGGASHFGQWKSRFLEPYNLIGINMQYTDGDNSADAAGKVDAAVEALRQTMADYKVVAGRGAVASFSGGGLVHSLLFERFAQGRSEHEGIRWPGNHSSLYGSNYWRRPSDPVPMSWYIGVGTKEWGMGQPTLGSSSTARARDLYGLAVRKGYCSDIRLNVIDGKGHSIAPADVSAAAEQFARSDCFLAPFVYEPDYAEHRELEAVAALANHGYVGRAAKRLGRLLRGASSLSAEARGKGTALKAVLEARVKRMVESSESLLEKDPVLAFYYCKEGARRLSGLPEGRELLKKLSSALRKDRKRAAAVNLLPPFAKGIGEFFTAGGRLRTECVALLENVKSVAGEEALIGTMAAQFTKLK